MKLQHLAVIFIIIIMPITMVIATYVGNLIDVTNKQAKYDAILMNATYDAVRAHQMSTLNNTFASVNASRIRDLNATVNTFFNSLATGLSFTGYRKDDLHDYVPAVLINLYDGYYVYGPYENYAKVENGNLSYITSDSDKPNSEYGLKPFTSYTCQYKKEGEYNIIVNYTLDNYISVAGTYKEGTIPKYITASGYYIDPNNVKRINDDNTVILGEEPNQIILQPEELTEWLSAYNKIRINEDSNVYVNSEHQIAKYRYVNMSGEKYYFDHIAEVEDQSYQGFPIFKLDGNLKVYISRDKAKELADYLKLTGNWEDKIKNIDNYKDISYYWYYKEARDFSEKVEGVLSQIDISEDVIPTKAYNQKYEIETNNYDDTDEKMTSHIKTDYATKKIFDYTVEGNDPELDSSSFNQHRMDVIISSIEHSLATSIVNFNNYESGSYDYRMPTISETDWNKIANNINILSFMQGLVVGNFKYYNNYSLVSNTKNKEFISKEAIRVQEVNNNTSTDNEAVNVNYHYYSKNFHVPTCKTFHNEIISDGSKKAVGYRMIDYEIQSYEYGTDSTQNYYMQAGTGGYECVISNNEDMWTYDEMMKGNKTNSEDDNGMSNEVRRAYISALAREKANSYQNLENLNEPVLLDN